MGGTRPIRRRKGPYRIGEVAAATGLSRQTIHQYVLLGLVRPQGTTPGGHRLFGGGVIRRIEEIQALKRDRTLAQIRALGRGPRRGRHEPGRES